MIMHNIAWSLGATPNKSLESFGAFICSHSQGDPTAADNRPLTGRRPAAYPSDRDALLISACPKPGASNPPDFSPAEPGDTRRILTADTLARRSASIPSIESIDTAGSLPCVPRIPWFSLISAEEPATFKLSTSTTLTA
jgi:hypothetical protein